MKILLQNNSILWPVVCRATWKCIYIYINIQRERIVETKIQARRCCASRRYDPFEAPAHVHIYAIHEAAATTSSRTSYIYRRHKSVYHLHRAHAVWSDLIFRNITLFITLLLLRKKMFVLDDKYLYLMTYLVYYLCKLSWLKLC